MSGPEQHWARQFVETGFADPDVRFPQHRPRQFRANDRLRISSDLRRDKTREMPLLRRLGRLFAPSFFVQTLISKLALRASPCAADHPRRFRSR